MSPSPKRQEDVASHFSELDRKKLDDIFSAVVGDEALGHRGLVNRMNTAEKIIFTLVLVVIIIGGEKLLHFFL